jgi:hypothetical protein
LRRSPRHWYDKISGVLKSLGLQPNPYDPCVFSGFLTDPNDPSGTSSDVPITLGLYVDDFVYFSEDDAVERKFESLLGKALEVDFMGTVEWFLGIHFSWRVTPSEVSAHLNQAGFAANTVERFGRHDRDMSPLATPYRSGVPIDSIAPSTDEEDAPAQVRRTAAYQSLVGCIGWLAYVTRPDLAPVHSFLAAYQSKPSVGHMRAALHALHYIHSTHDYGISFSSSTTEPMHTFVHFPDSSDVEAYSDAKPPTRRNRHTLTSYSDACWGSQIGSAVREGTLLPLFKFRSMSGGIVFRCGGPIAWTSVRQDQTSLSSCEAEIKATSEASKLLKSIQNLAQGLVDNGLSLPDLMKSSMLYNDNEACVAWSHNMTSKQVRHLELRENRVREWVQDGSIRVSHVAGKCNPADIFTKEMRDGAHFRRLRDSFMCRLSSFQSESMLHIYHKTSSAPMHGESPVASFGSSETSSASLLSLILTSSFFRNPTNVSHLSSAGRHIVRRSYPVIPPSAC